MSGEQIDAGQEMLEALSEAGRLMEETARLEGIDDHSPLGALIKVQRRAMDSFALVAKASANQVASSIKSLEVDRAAHLQELNEGKRQIEAMKNTARMNIEAQKLFRERELQDALERLVNGLMVDLKAQVFEKLRDKVPFNEHLFYREVKMSALLKLTALATAIMLLGMIGGYTATWHLWHVGEACEANEHVDPRDGKLWCSLPFAQSPPGQSDQQNDTDHEATGQGTGTQTQ